MSKARDISEEQLKEREDSKARKEEETKRKKEEYAENARRAVENKIKAEEAIKKSNKKKSTNYSYHIMFGLLGALIIYVVAMTLINQTPPLHKVQVIDEKKIEEFNANSIAWKQGPSSFFEGMTLADAKKLFSSGFSNNNNLNRCQIDESIPIPDSFNAVTQWPNCFLPIPDTGKTCGSSYAFTLTSTFAERKCIANNAEKPVALSAQELLTCDVVNNGCKGGYLNSSLDYFRAKGIVDATCYEYNPELDKCEGLCENPNRTRLDAYCLLIGEEDIKRDILKNGPAASTIQIYIDFLTYQSGVYTKADDIARFAQQHSIKIVGWGVESEGEHIGNKYWIIQNNWGTSWGENGYAKIAFGQELFFDQYAYSLKSRVEVKPLIEEAKDTATDTSETKSEEQIVNLDLDDLKN